MCVSLRLEHEGKTYEVKPGESVIVYLPELGRARPVVWDQKTRMRKVDMVDGNPPALSGMLEKGARYCVIDGVTEINHHGKWYSVPERRVFGVVRNEKMYILSYKKGAVTDDKKVR